MKALNSELNKPFFGWTSKSIQVMLIIFSFLSIHSSAQTSDLIISEYIEGSGNEKFIEIFNGTGASVNLANYAIRLFSNGAVAPTSTSALTGTLLDGAVNVYRNTGATNVAGSIVLPAINFNGDDAVELYNTLTSTSIDVFGNIGCDPGTQWTGGGSFDTQNMTLVRNASVCSPVLDPASTCPFPTLTTEWTPTSLDDLSGLGSHTNACVSSVIISTGTHTGDAYSVDCSTSDNGTLTFTTIGVFNGGNVFTAQLSDDSGVFGSPISIGTLAISGVNPGGTINLTIPAASNTSSNYIIRIISSDPFGISDSTSTFTINLTGGPCVFTPPHLTGVIINSCDGSCNEGDNELVFGNTGDYSVDVTAGNFNFLYGSPNPPTTNYTDVLVTNPGTTADINADAGCPGTYIEGTGETIPPNSSFILAPNALCTDALTWSGLCGSGPIYVIYQNDGSWMTGGNFSNSTAAGSRYFRTVITATDGTTHTIDYNYDRSQNGGSDGDYVTYGPAGGAPFSYLDDDCAIEPTIALPLELISFTAEKTANNSAHLHWKTASERNTAYFQIERLSPENSFESIGSVSASGYSSSVLEYDFYDLSPYLGTNYYRLKMVDQNGSLEYSEIRSLTFEDTKLALNQIDMENFSLNKSVKNGSIHVLSSNGQLIESLSIQNSNSFSIHKPVSGIYFISIRTENEVLTQKILIQ